MSELTKDLWRSTWTESITICITQPTGWRVPLSQGDALHNALGWDASVELEGPGPNGIWAVTFKNTTLTEDDLRCLVVRVFAQFLQEVRA